MKLSIADYLSLSRIPLGILFFVLIHNKIISFVLLLIIILTDVSDGFLARKLRQVTIYGGALDPITDKFFIVGAFLAYAIIGLIPVWVFFILIIRDIYSGIEMLIILITKHKDRHKASIWGKVTTALQFLMIATLIFELTVLFLPLLVAAFISSLATIYNYAGRRWFK